LQFDGYFDFPSRPSQRDPRDDHRLLPRSRYTTGPHDDFGMACAVQHLGTQHVAIRALARFRRQFARELRARRQACARIVDDERNDRQPDLESGLTGFGPEPCAARFLRRRDHVVVTETGQRTVPAHQHRQHAAIGIDLEDSCAGRHLSLGSALRQRSRRHVGAPRRTTGQCPDACDEQQRSLGYHRSPADTTRTIPIMQLRNTADNYGALAKFLHWTIVILIIAQYVIIEAAEELPDGLEKLTMITRHKSIGILVLALALVRIGWKLANKGQPAPVPMPRPQRIAAAAGHGLLYLLILAQPISGWMMSSAANYPVTFFGWFELPALVAANEDMHEFYEEVHEFLFTALLVVTVVHVLAALYHHFVQKDDTLRRMLPFGRRRTA